MANINEISMENAKAQMRRGILELCILSIISRGNVYANDILKELKRANLIVVEGTIYPLLTRLKNSGILDYSWRESKNGPPRKYYCLTSKGRKSLHDLATTWQELDQSINALIKKFK